MKTMIKKLVMPIAVMCIAITVALAGNITTDDIKSSDERLGFTKVANTCTPTAKMCSIITEGPVCRDGVTPLYEFNGSSCPDILYEKLD